MILGEFDKGTIHKGMGKREGNHKQWSKYTQKSSGPKGKRDRSGSWDPERLTPRAALRGPCSSANWNIFTKIHFTSLAISLLYDTVCVKK